MSAEEVFQQWGVLSENESAPAPAFYIAPGNPCTAVLKFACVPWKRSENENRTPGSYPGAAILGIWKRDRTPGAVPLIPKRQPKPYPGAAILSQNFPKMGTVHRTPYPPKPSKWVPYPLLRTPLFSMHVLECTPNICT